ncbi:MAG: hypothetical protein R3C02_20370 [Planctomycetaceae bacterium]
MLLTVQLLEQCSSLGVSAIRHRRRHVGIVSNVRRFLDFWLLDRLWFIPFQEVSFPLPIRVTLKPGLLMNC